ncbi:tetratricopeptide repeat protein [Flavobacterium sp. PLA-1-15]|uniref:tetratricopeptide repeat protein n=1 Tax=Flavobacterium sp. PLA-1-15 TaxID=3380533 RepID=UPI003B76F474
MTPSKNFFKSFYILAFLVMSYSCFATVDPKKHCDSLIKEGLRFLWKKDHVKSLEVLTEARAIAEKNLWYEQMFSSIQNIGGNYYMMLDYGEALSYYLKSHEIAVKHLDPSYEFVILNNIAIIYTSEKKYDKSESYLKQALALSLKLKDSVKTGYSYINLAELANDRKELSQARVYLKQSLVYLKNAKDVRDFASIILVKNDLLSGFTQKARKDALHLLSTINSEQYPENVVHLHIVIAKSYFKEHDLEQALAYAFKALADKPNLEIKKEILQLMSEIYFEKKDFKLAIQYKDSINSTDSKLYEIKNNQLFKTNEVKFQIQNYEREIAQKDSKIVSERKFFYSIVVIGVIAILFLIFVFRQQRIKNKQLKVIAQHNQEIVELKLQKEIDDNLLSKRKEEIALLEQERLMKEIELKNQKISSKALYTSGRDEILEQILNSLTDIPQLSGNKLLINHIKALKNHIKTDNDWDDFILHFEEVNHGFLKKLKAKHPELTPNDIRFIAYVYMDLTSKEIASMLNITLEACRKRKERIIQKLGLPEDISLNAYLTSI